MVRDDENYGPKHLESTKLGKAGVEHLHIPVVQGKGKSVIMSSKIDLLT